MTEDKLIADLKKEGFKKIEPGEVWDFEAEKIMRGIFLNKEENVGPNNSNLYNFRLPDGKSVSVWGSSIIDVRLKNVEMGEEVVIIYHGRAVGEKSGREYHNYEIYHRPPVKEERDITEKEPSL